MLGAASLFVHGAASSNAKVASRLAVPVAGVTMAVLHYGVAHETQLRHLTDPFSIKPDFAIGGAGMSVVLTFFTAIVPLGVAPGL